MIQIRYKCRAEHFRAHVVVPIANIFCRHFPTLASLGRVCSTVRVFFESTLTVVHISLKPATVNIEVKRACVWAQPRVLPFLIMELTVEENRVLRPSVTDLVSVEISALDSRCCCLDTRPASVDEDHSHCLFDISQRDVTFRKQKHCQT